MFATGAQPVRLLAASSAIALLALTGCSDGEPPAMPDVVGKTLDVGLVEIEDSGFGDKAEVVGGGVFGVVDEANWLICDQEPSAGSPITSAPTLTVDRACDDTFGGAGGPTEGDTDLVDEFSEPTGAPESTDAPAPGDTAYAGPPYEVVVTDENVTPANLTQYWVLIAPADLSTDAYKDSVRALISDLARKNGEPEIMVEVVTNREIAEAESPSSSSAFIEDYGAQYFLETIPALEVEGWVASYRGGLDGNTLEPSSSAEAYEIIWRPYATAEIETWKP